LVHLYQMNINIENNTKYNYIKFYVYYSYVKDGIDTYDELETDFYSIKDKDTISIDTREISVITLKVYINNDKNKGYRFKYKYTSFKNNLNITLNKGEEHPVLLVNNCRPDSREDWSISPIDTCYSFLSQKLCGGFKQV
jgi:hypothetical protein